MAGKFSKRFFPLFAGILGSACLWYLIEKFEWREAFALLLKTDFLKLTVLIFLTQFAYILLRTWRWRAAIRETNPNISFLEMYWITAIVLSLSIFTPGQSGEALKIELLKRRGHLDRLPGLGIFTLERTLDVLVIAGMGIAGLVFSSSLAKVHPHVLPAIGAVFAVGLLLFYLLFRFNNKGQVYLWLSKMRAGIGTPIVWLKMSFLTLGSWFFVGLSWYISLRAVDIDITLADILWLVPLVTLGSIFSLIPGGLGLAEVLTAESLTLLGSSPIEAQAGAIILRVYGLIILLYGAAHLLLWFILRYKRSIRL